MRKKICKNLRPLTGRQFDKAARAASRSTAAATTPGSLTKVRCRASGINTGAGAPIRAAVPAADPGAYSGSSAPYTTDLGIGRLAS